MFSATEAGPIGSSLVEPTLFLAAFAVCSLFSASSATCYYYCVIERYMYSTSCYYCYTIEIMSALTIVDTCIYLQYPNTEESVVYLPSEGHC